MLKTFCHLHDEEGIFRFYVGGALGVDMWAAEQLLYLKEQPGYQDIELIVALPFEGHDSKWDAMSKQRLQIIIHNATKCIVIGQSGTTSDYKKRNYYMVDHAFLAGSHVLKIQIPLIYLLFIITIPLFMVFDRWMRKQYFKRHS